MHGGRRSSFLTLCGYVWGTAVVFSDTVWVYYVCCSQVQEGIPKRVPLQPSGAQPPAAREYLRTRQVSRAAADTHHAVHGAGPQRRPRMTRHRLQVSAQKQTEEAFRLSKERTRHGDSLRLMGCTPFRIIIFLSVERSGGLFLRNPPGLSADRGTKWRPFLPLQGANSSWRQCATDGHNYV